MSDYWGDEGQLVCPVTREVYGLSIVFSNVLERERGWSSEQSSFKIWLNDFHSLQRFRHWNSHWKHFLQKTDHKTPVATRCAENASQNDNGDSVCRNVTSNRWWHIFQSSKWASIKCWLRNWEFSNFWEHWSQIRLSSSSNSKFVGILCACASGAAKESELKAKQGRFESVFKGYRDNLQIACNLLHAAKI